MTPAEFKARYPVFATIDNAFVQLVITEQEQVIDLQRWGELYSKGVMLLTAHELTINNPQMTQVISNGLSSDKTQVKAGDVSYSRDASLMLKYENSPYSRTTYGQQYLYLLRQVGIGIMTV